MNKKILERIMKLVFYSVVVGALVGFFELYIGHRYILDPLLYNKDYNFVYESYFAPTYYGLTKSIVVAITFFLVYLFTFKKKIKPALKSTIVGILGTAFFGFYYYLTFPRSEFFSSIIIGIVHFSFIFGISYLFDKFAKIEKK